MIHMIVAIKDRAADAYLRPIFTKTVAEAIRIFQDEMNREAQDNLMFHHPDDFDLYTLGKFDDNTGELIPSKPEQVAIGKNSKLKP